jgi:hypothetical protein
MASTDRTRRELRNRARLALWLAVPFIALMLLVSPRGDFPLNDDWVYAKMVQALTERGHFGISPLSNAYALTQTLYAVPLVKLFGFSFTLLRFTTIFMGWITVCFVAFTARELGLPNRSAVLAALTVFVNPLFINLSYTFMTDVPFCAFASIGTYYFVKALRAPTTANLLLGTLFSIVAFYNRQLGALIPVAFVFSAAAAFRCSPSRLDARKLACLIAPWILGLVILPLLAAPESDRLTVQVDRTLSLSDIVFEAGWLLVTLTTYVGLFLLPIAAGLAFVWQRVHVSRLTRGWQRVFALFFAIAILGCFPLCFFPFLPNIVRDFGVGPALFSFIEPRWRMGIHFAPVEIGFAWTVAAYVATAAFSVVIDGARRQFRNSGARYRPVRKAQMWFLLVCGMLYLAAPFTSVPTNYFDRYVLSAIPPLAVFVSICLGYRPAKQRLILPIFAASALLTWSVVGLQDYMAWNTARWQAIDSLRTKHQADDNDINGGFEFNGMYTSGEYLRRSREEPHTFKHKKWWVIGETFRVSPVDLTQHHSYYEILEKFPYYSWLGFQTRYIYALKHADPNASGPPEPE